MRPSWKRMALDPVTGVLVKEGRFETQTEEKPCEGSRGCSDAAASQGRQEPCSGDSRCVSHVKGSGELGLSSWLMSCRAGVPGSGHSRCKGLLVRVGLTQ